MFKYFKNNNKVPDIEEYGGCRIGDCVYSLFVYDEKPAGSAYKVEKIIPCSYDKSVQGMEIKIEEFTDHRFISNIGEIKDLAYDDHPSFCLKIDLEKYKDLIFAANNPNIKFEIGKLDYKNVYSVWWHCSNNPVGKNKPRSINDRSNILADVLKFDNYADAKEFVTFIENCDETQLNDILDYGYVPSWRTVVVDSET